MKPEPMAWPKSMLLGTFATARALEKAQGLFPSMAWYQFVAGGDRDKPFYRYDKNLRLIKRACNYRGPTFRNAFITEYYAALVTR